MLPRPAGSVTSALQRCVLSQHQVTLQPAQRHSNEAPEPGRATGSSVHDYCCIMALDCTASASASAAPGRPKAAGLSCSVSSVKRMKAVEAAHSCDSSAGLMPSSSSVSGRHSGSRNSWPHCGGAGRSRGAKRG